MNNEFSKWCGQTEGENIGHGNHNRIHLLTMCSTFAVKIYCKTVKYYKTKRISYENT